MDKTSFKAFLEASVKNQGFKKNKKVFTKQLIETEAELELQTHSFGKSQYLINLTISFKPEIAILHQLSDVFAAWCRVESLSEEEKIQNLRALDYESDLSFEMRNEQLTKIFEVDLPRFLDIWKTYNDAEIAYKKSIKKHAPINSDLVNRWKLS